MSPRRVTLLITSLVVAGLLVWLLVVRWDNANKIAAVVSALAAVAAVGVAVWAALPSSVANGGARASRTGKAIARRKSNAISGIVSNTRKATGQLEADRTGDADASDGADATSGVRLD